MFTLPLLQLGLMHVLGTGPFLDPTAIRDPWRNDGISSDLLQGPFARCIFQGAFS